jgi:hypothetical protein
MRPPALPGGSRPIVALNVTGIGQGLVTSLFEDDFLTEQVNLIFCSRPERVLSVQVLFDDRRALGRAEVLLQEVYGLPVPVRFETYQPSMRYPLAGVRYDEQGTWQIRPDAPSVTVWDLGTAEVVYQQVLDQSLVTGQIWVTDKSVSNSCAQ